MKSHRTEPLVEQQRGEEAIRYKRKLEKYEIMFADGTEKLLPCPKARRLKRGQRRRK